MLLNMFVGRPEGNYDHLLDVSRAVTGNLFFVPSVPVLESLAEDEPAEATAHAAADPAGPAPALADAGSPAPADQPAGSGSLNIGSLRGVSQDG